MSRWRSCHGGSSSPSRVGCGPNMWPANQRAIKTSMFRRIVLAETARPTLGRKHVVDQRTAIASAANRHELDYDDVRKKVVIKSVVTTPTPAAHRWKREKIEGIVRDLKAGPAP